MEKIVDPAEIFDGAALDNWNDFAQGRISFAEYEKRKLYLFRRQMVPRLREHVYRGEWEDFINMSLAMWELLPIAFEYYDDVPDELKYQFCTQAYTHHGDSIPAVRKAVRGALKYGKPDLPGEIATADEVIVYRAGEESINKAKYRISWTTDMNVALFFLNEYRSRHASHLYVGKIKPEKIIAYTDERNEREIMQYANVYDIEDITEDVL